jgi:hypothetical protein
MSTAPTPPAAPTPAIPSSPREIRIYSHSSLYYWWPVWFFGLIFAAWSWFDGDRLAIVPGDSRIVEIEKIAEADGTSKYKLNIRVGKGDEFVSEKNRLLADAELVEKKEDKAEWMIKPRVTSNAAVGPLFFVILSLVIFITNVPLRGLWSLIVIFAIIAVSLLLTILKLWDDLFRNFSALHIFMNLSGYLFLTVVVGVMWVISVFIFDRRTYMIFTPGQVKVCEEVGGREKVYDTTGMSLEKQRADWFRHIILGFGSGDLTIRTAGADRHELTMNNVAMINFKITQIEQLTRERQTKAVV